MPREELRPGDRVADRYRIVRPIGAGGMGAVYEAEQLTLRRRVALKVLFDDDDDALARFEQEALALARIRHPNVVGVIDFHRDQGGSAFLVMDLLEGESLLDRIKREERLDLDAVIDIAAAVLAGLDVIHQRGIIHRDLKPSNIFLAHEGVKIVDFGIVKLIGEPGLTTTNPYGPIGTPSFLAPEQLRGEEPDARTDLHALGICMYVMLTGASPWKSRLPTEVTAEILRDDPQPLHELRPDIPPRLEQIVHRALTKDRADRFASASDMLRVLTATRSTTIEDPIDAAPPTQPDPGPKIIKTLPLAPAPAPVRTIRMADAVMAPLSPGPSMTATTPSPLAAERSSPPREVPRWVYGVICVGVALAYAGVDRVQRLRAPHASVPTPVTTPEPTSASTPAPSPFGDSLPPPATASVIAARASAAPSASTNAHVFNEDELEGMLSSAPRDGKDEIKGKECYCLPVEVTRGQMTEAAALACTKCSGVAVEGSWRCKGTDASGRLRDGRYLCRGFPRRVDRRIKGIGQGGADDPLY